MRRKLSEREGCLLTPPGAGQACFLSVARGPWALPGPCPQACIDFQTLSLPQLSASIMGVQPLLSHIQKDTWFKVLPSNTKFLNNFETGAPNFHLAHHELCRLANYVVGLASIRQWASSGKRQAFAFFASLVPTPAPDRRPTGDTQQVSAALMMTETLGSPLFHSTEYSFFIIIISTPLQKNPAKQEG